MGPRVRGLIQRNAAFSSLTKSCVSRRTGHFQPCNDGPSTVVYILEQAKVIKTLFALTGCIFFLQCLQTSYHMKSQIERITF